MFSCKTSGHHASIVEKINLSTMPMKFPVSATLALLAIGLLPSTALSDSAVEIDKKHDLEKIAALNTYLEANPEAEDRDMALNILVDANMSMGEFTPVPGLLTQRYELQDKGPDANLQLIVAQIIRPFIESSIVSNQRDKAKAFVTKIKSDYAANPQSPQLNQFIDQLAPATITLSVANVQTTQETMGVDFIGYAFR